MAAYEVKSVTEDQVPDQSGVGNLQDVFDIVFTIPGHTGDFTVQVVLGGDTVKDAYNAISAKVATVDAIYAGGTGTTGA